MSGVWAASDSGKSHYALASPITLLQFSIALTVLNCFGINHKATTLTPTLLQLQLSGSSELTSMTVTVSLFF